MAAVVSSAFLVVLTTTEWHVGHTDLAALQDTVYTTTDAGSVVQYDTKKGRVVREWGDVGQAVIAAEGNRVYAATASGVVKVMSSTTSEIISSINTSAARLPRRIIVNNEVAYLLGEGSFTVVNTTRPTASPQIVEVHGEKVLTNGFVEDDMLHIVGGSSSVYQVRSDDLTVSPSRLHVDYNLPVFTHFSGLKYIFTVSYDGLTIYEKTRVVGRLDGIEKPEDIVEKNGFAYVSTRNRLITIDVRDSAKPIIVDTREDTTSGRLILPPNGSLMYHGVYGSGIAVYNVAKNIPRVVGWHHDENLQKGCSIAAGVGSVVYYAVKDVVVAVGMKRGKVASRRSKGVGEAVSTMAEWGGVVYVISATGRMLTLSPDLLRVSVVSGVTNIPASDIFITPFGMAYCATPSSVSIFSVPSWRHLTTVTTSIHSASPHVTARGDMVYLSSPQGGLSAYRLTKSSNPRPTDYSYVVYLVVYLLASVFMRSLVS